MKELWCTRALIEIIDIQKNLQGEVDEVPCLYKAKYIFHPTKKIPKKEDANRSQGGCIFHVDSTQHISNEVMGLSLRPQRCNWISWPLKLNSSTWKWNNLHKVKAPSTEESSSVLHFIFLITSAVDFWES